jgi:hypothetical protein
MLSYNEILPNQKYILEDITSILYSGNAFWHLVKNFFFLVFYRKNMEIKMCRTSSFQKSVINMAIKLFNHLSTELKQLDDFNLFRRKVKLFLLSKPLYTLEEYFD